MSVSIDQIVEAQGHIGTLKSESHPKTKKYWLDVVDGMVVLNPEIMAQKLEKIRTRIQLAKKAGNDVLIICEKKMYADELEALSKKTGYFFLNHKVPSGFLTNFDTLKKRVVSMKKMITFMESDDFFSLTKKEQFVTKRNLAKVQKVYKGIQDLQKRPDLVIVVDGTKMSGLIDEIEKQDVENIVLASTDFPRWWNDDNLLLTNVTSYKSLDFVLKYILS